MDSLIFISVTYHGCDFDKILSLRLNFFALNNYGDLIIFHKYYFLEKGWGFFLFNDGDRGSHEA